MDLHKSLSELESRDLNGKKNATHYECLTKSERSHFLEKEAPPFVGNALALSTLLVRGKGCSDRIKYRIGRRRERCRLLKVLKVDGQS